MLHLDFYLHVVFIILLVINHDRKYLVGTTSLQEKGGVVGNMRIRWHLVAAALFLCHFGCYLTAEKITVSCLLYILVTRNVRHGFFDCGKQVGVSPSVDCQNLPQAAFAFCNTSLSAAERASDLVSRLSQEELIAQTSSIAPAISRLGIKDYNWRSNCLHGWTASGGSWPSGLYWTVFPAPINLAATFNPSLVLQVGLITADEGRALHNVMLARYNGSSTEAAGLNCFSPNVNLFRDPRWGRGQETLGEDPFLISVLGNAYTVGLQQGEDPKYLKVAACAKHFAVHSGPEELRLGFTAYASTHDLYDTYLPAFKSQVLGARVAQIMPAYSGLRCAGIPAGAPDCANPFLLQSVLRDQFGAQNLSIISDNGGVGFVFSEQHYTNTLEEAAVVSMDATTDIDLGHDEVYSTYLPNAISDRLINPANVQDAIWRAFYLRMLLGDFDPPSQVPYQSIDASHLNTPQNQASNLLAAHQSMVLLKNDGTLPLKTAGVTKVAILGPNANATSTLLSNYQGIPQTVVSVQQGIADALAGTKIQIVSAPGCADVVCGDTSGFADALSAATGADYVVMVMGLDASVEGEGHDRAQTACEGVAQDNLALPGCQTALVQQVVKVNPRVVLVLINGGPVSISTLFDSSGVVGILEAFYPGAAGGLAVADVLLGKYNPGGRMPVTTYEGVADLLPSINYNMTDPPGRTYRYYTGSPLIPFGYGLSYTTFEYSKLSVLPPTVAPCASVYVTFTVQNVGAIAGDEVMQVYVKPPRIAGRPFFPNIQLLGVDRRNMNPSTNYDWEFVLSPYALSLVDDDGENYIFPGVYTVYVGGGLPETPLDTTTISSTFSIEGDIVNVKDCPDSPQCLACM